MAHDIEVRKLVILPRYTSFSGATAFRTAPMNVRAYASTMLSLWFGSPIGSGTGLTVDVEESPDLKIWETLASVTPTPGTETQQSVQFTMEWIRTVVTLNGTDPAFTGWCVGDFVTRVLRG